MRFSTIGKIYVPWPQTLVLQNTRKTKQNLLSNPTTSTLLLTAQLPCTPPNFSTPLSVQAPYALHHICLGVAEPVLSLAKLCQCQSQCQKYPGPFTRHLKQISTWCPQDKKQWLRWILLSWLSWFALWGHNPTDLWSWFSFLPGDDVALT